MLIRRVQGNSMLPGLVPGIVVVAWGSRVRAGDIVIAKQASREVIKRVHSIRDGGYVLRGDNDSDSVDSREFGPVKKEAILGVVMLKLAVAVNPPNPRRSYAGSVGWAAASLMIVAALVHLFRIDTFLPLLDNALPGSYTVAALVGSLIVAAEVFAVPFLLRMKLSPLMHLKSGFLAVIAPLTWLLIGVWQFGHGVSTAQSGEFLNTPSTIPLLMLDSAWLGLNLWALWLLGYDKLNLRKK